VNGPSAKKPPNFADVETPVMRRKGTQKRKREKRDLLPSPLFNSEPWQPMARGGHISESPVVGGYIVT